MDWSNLDFGTVYSQLQGSQDGNLKLDSQHWETLARLHECAETLAIDCMNVQVQTAFTDGTLFCTDSGTQQVNKEHRFSLVPKEENFPLVGKEYSSSLIPKEYSFSLGRKEYSFSLVHTDQVYLKVCEADPYESYCSCLTRDILYYKHCGTLILSLKRNLQ